MHTSCNWCKSGKEGKTRKPWPGKGFARDAPSGAQLEDPSLPSWQSLQEGRARLAELAARRPNVDKSKPTAAAGTSAAPAMEASGSAEGTTTPRPGEASGDPRNLLPAQEAQSSLTFDEKVKCYEDTKQALGSDHLATKMLWEQVETAKKELPSAPNSRTEMLRSSRKLAQASSKVAKLQKALRQAQGEAEEAIAKVNDLDDKLATAREQLEAFRHRRCDAASQLLAPADSLQAIRDELTEDSDKKLVDDLKGLVGQLQSRISESQLSSRLPLLLGASMDATAESSDNDSDVDMPPPPRVHVPKVVAPPNTVDLTSRSRSPEGRQPKQPRV